MRPCPIAAVALLLVAPVMAYPQYWAQEYAPNCLAVPIKGTNCHKAPVADRATAVSILDGGKPVKSICVGKVYRVTAAFPQPRLAYLTFGSGAQVTVKNTNNKRCPNTMTFSSNPGKAVSVTVAAPTTPGQWQMGVVSATGSCSPFYITSATFAVAKC